MEKFCFTVCGKPHNIQKIYNKLKNFFSEFDYVSDSYVKTTLLPRGTSEIEVLSKKGYIVSFFGEDFSFYSKFTTSFLRMSGASRGYNSKLTLKFFSENPSKLIRAISSIEGVDPSFEQKDNYTFVEEGNSDFSDSIL